MNWTNILDLESLFQILLTFILSGIIGAQRELKNKPAGFKPHAMIGISAVLCMIAGKKLSMNYNIDASRIPAQLISGIGFVGAGAILTDGLNVKGLNTSSCLLGVACIGLVVGAGAYSIAILTTILIMLLLVFGDKLFPGSIYHDQVEFIVEIKKDSQTGMKNIEKIFGKNALLIEKITLLNKEEDEITKKISYKCKYKSSLTFNKIITDISMLDDILNVEMINNEKLK